MGKSAFDKAAELLNPDITGGPAKVIEGGAEVIEKGTGVIKEGVDTIFDIFGRPIPK